MDPKLLNDEDIIKNNNDDLIFNPYNTINKEISLNDVQSILNNYGIPSTVHNLQLYQRAFVHKSYTRRPQLENTETGVIIIEKPDNAIGLKTKSNERLEFLGDGVLECITKYYLYRRFPKENEGFMTEKKIALVKNEALGKLALEMKLNNWLLLSRHAEEKKTRTNLKKLGCLFESFLGALFLDFNKITINDEDEWFKNVFVTGPGFQIAQIFVETIFEKHVDWIDLINNDDNYKNILQVKIQKEFKQTPDYLEIEHNMEFGYHMGVYLCLGQSIHEVSPSDALPFNKFNNFTKIHEYWKENKKLLVLLGQGTHKIKKKAEQLACDETLNLLKE